MKVKLAQMVNHLQRVVTRHIESGGDAHLPVDKEFSGFMTPEMLRELKESKGKGSWISSTTEKTDILKLSSGFYEGFTDDFKNLPSDLPAGRTLLVEVKEANGADKKIINITHTGFGRKWTILLNNQESSGLPAGWKRLEQKKILFSGNVESGTINFQENYPYKFDLGLRIETFFMGNYSTHIVNNGAAITEFSLAAINLSNDLTTTNANFGEVRLVKNSDTSVRIISNKSIGTDLKGYAEIGTDKLAITKIVGLF